MDLSERLATSRVARDLAYRQLDAQLRAFDSFDFKAAGLLGLDGAGLAAILAAKDTFGGGWWYPALGVLVSAVFALFGIVLPGNGDRAEPTVVAGS